MQDMAPAAKTLQEAHDASLLYDDDGDVPADNVSESGEQEVDEPPSKRCKSYLGTHRSIPEAGQSTADLNSRVDSLVTVMTENEVMGPATSAKIASVLNNILAGGLKENPPRSGKKKFIALQTANCLHKLVSTLRFGRLPLLHRAA